MWLRDGGGEVVLVGEVRVERTLRDVGFFGDVVDRERVEAARGDQTFGRGDKFAACAFAFSGDPRQSFTFHHGRHYARPRICDNAAARSAVEFLAAPMLRHATTRSGRTSTAPWAEISRWRTQAQARIAVVAVDVSDRDRVQRHAEILRDTLGCVAPRAAIFARDQQEVARLDQAHQRHADAVGIFDLGVR